jgi:pentalenene oxygenase
MARDEETGEGLSDDHVRGEALTMLAAGTQTTATTIAWALHILSVREDIQDRAYREIREVLGDRAVTSDDLDRLDYLRRLLSETLRLYPPAWLLSRRAAVEVRLGGHVLPAGASILFSPYAVHRDPSSYADRSRRSPDQHRRPWPPRHPPGHKPADVDQAASADAVTTGSLPSRPPEGRR